MSHPLALSDDQVVEHAEFSQRLRALPGGENLLYGGDFEDLEQMTQFGWQHVRGETSGVDAGARLSPIEPRLGAYCLEISAAARPESPGMTGAPAVWVISPPVPVDEGSAVEITGWVRVDHAIADSVDGLQIFDSLGGAELSLSVRKTDGWQQFRIIRGVPSSTELRLTFALSGIGSACIDGVMVRGFQPAAVRRLPPVTPINRSATTDDGVTGPMFVTPGTR
jgi:hypothetical protein